MTLRVLAVPDKFKGTATADSVATAVAAAVAEAGGACVRLPMSDGGEGLLEAFGGANRRSDVTGPLGGVVSAEWRYDEATAVAVLESARACGLTLAGGPERNDPMTASTAGVGELVAAAVSAGARRVVVGVGGSASTDGGVGALEALHYGGPGRLPALLATVEVEVCCDVDTLFTRAAEVFGPQKGADARQVVALAARLRDLRVRWMAAGLPDPDGMPGSGAAGGLAGGLATLGARLVRGVDVVADAVGLDSAIAATDLVVTGEGRVDGTSLAGKVVGGVVARCRSAGVPVVVVAGSVADGVDLGAGVTVVDLSRSYGAERSVTDPTGCVRDALAGLLGAHDPGTGGRSAAGADRPPAGQ